MIEKDYTFKLTGGTGNHQFSMSSLIYLTSSN